MPNLNLQNITMNFGGLTALASVDLEVRAGKIQALIGPNGSGKTTLFNIVTGFYKPSGGSIYFEGNNITHMPPHIITKMGISRTFQNIKLFNEMTVLDNIKVGCHCHTKTELMCTLLKLMRGKEEERVIEDQALQILEFLNLVDQKDRLPKHLPYGQQRLVEIGRALASKPKMLLLDEPTAGMNSQEISILIEYIKRINEQGCTIFLVEHHMKLVMKLSDHIAVLNFGKKIAEGSPSEIQQNHKVIEAYLGTGAGY